MASAAAPTTLSPLKTTASSASSFSSRASFLPVSSSSRSSTLCGLGFSAADPVFVHYVTSQVHSIGSRARPLKSLAISMGKKSVADLTGADLKGKKVLVRADLNVPLDDNQNIIDDTRIRAAVLTIQHLIQSGAKVILSSHLGRPKGVTPKFSLAHLVARLSELLGIQVVKADDCIGPDVERLVASLPEGGVLLLENVRFYKEEEKNDPEFAKKLASLADLYLNDALGTAHRADASTEEVIKLLKPCVAGFLLQKELDYHVGAVSTPKGPFAAIVGGSKVIAKKLADLSGKGVTTIIGGGDSVAAVENAGVADVMSHISSGGGACLELLEGKELPGVLAFDEAVPTCTMLSVTFRNPLFPAPNFKTLTPPFPSHIRTAYPLKRTHQALKRKSSRVYASLENSGETSNWVSWLPTGALSGDKIFKLISGSTASPICQFISSPTTFLHSVDPRIKLVWLLALVVLPARSHIVIRIGLVLYIALLSIWVLPRTVWRDQLGRVSLLSGILFITLGLGSDGVPALVQLRTPPPAITGLPNIPRSLVGYSYLIMKLGPLQFTRKGLAVACTAACLTFTIFQSASLCLATTTPEQLAFALRWFMLPLSYIGVPVAEIILTLLLSLRFINLVFDEVRHVALGIVSHRINWQQLTVMETIDIFASYIRRIFKNIFNHAEQISQAMIVRGFRGDSKTHKIYFLSDTSIGMADFVSLLCLVAVVGAALLSDYFFL